MAPRPNSSLATVLATALATALVLLPLGEASAASADFGTLAAGPSCAAIFPGNGGGGHNGGGHNGGGHGSTIIINKPVTIFKPVTINNKVNIYKPITINKSVSINKPVTINKSITINKPVTINNNINITKNIDNSKHIDITKNIDLSKNINIEKNVTINKSIVINKGGSGEASASAFAFASAYAAAQANASASAQAISYGGNQYVSVSNQGSGNVGGNVSVNAQNQCVEQEANVVKSIHAVCIDRTGREYPASHMTPETWVEGSYEGEIARCIPGATVRAMVGNVAQSDQGLAGTYEGGQTLACAAGEALVHYRGGMLKCARAKPVKDCTERVNLRRWGSGDFFFSYHARVCVAAPAEASAGSEDLSGMTLEGGVGTGDSGY